MKKRALINPGYEALSDNLPESMGQHRMSLVHALTMHTLRHYKPLDSEKSVRNIPEGLYPYANKTSITQQPAFMSPETQAQVFELKDQRVADNQADIRREVDLAYDSPATVNLANENPLYDQKAA